MSESQISIGLVGGTTVDTPGASRPDLAPELGEMTATTPQLGFQDYTLDNMWSADPRMYFKFTAPRTGSVYLGAWPSHWADADGNPIFGQNDWGGDYHYGLAAVQTGPLIPIEQWYDYYGRPHGTSYQDYYWERSYLNNGESRIEVEEGQTYHLLVLAENVWNRPPNAASLFLTLVIGDVQVPSPWQDRFIVPTVLRNGEPWPRPDGDIDFDALVDEQEDSEDEADAQEDLRIRASAHFVGRT